MIAMTCVCITFVGLIAIAIMKISSKNSFKPINVPPISSRLLESIQAIHTSRIDEPQDTFELRAVQSHSRIIHVAPIHLEEQSCESLRVAAKNNNWKKVMVLGFGKSYVIFRMGLGKFLHPLTR